MCRVHTVKHNYINLYYEYNEGSNNNVFRTFIILIIEVNKVVFDCVYSTRNSLPLYKETQREWRTSEYMEC